MAAASGVAAARQAVVDGRRDDERQNHGDQQAADDGNSERLQHLRSRADGEGQGKHSADRCNRGHHDGAKAALGGVQHCLAGQVAGDGLVVISHPSR